MADTETLIRDLLKKIAIEQRYDDGNIDLYTDSSAIGNYTSKLYRAKITTPNRELKLFIKAAVINEQMRQCAFKTLYEKEQEFYTRIARIYDNLQDKHNIQGYDRLILPKFFGCHPTYGEEILVLEDLEESGLKLWDKHRSVDWQFATKAVSELAKFHALSLAYGVEEPESSKKLLEDMKYVTPIDPETLKMYLGQSLNWTAEAIPEQYRERFLKFMFENGDMSKNDYKYCQPVLKPVLRHADYKIGNLMYKECSDGNLQLSILDFQTLHTGCGLADLMIFIYTGTDKDFRQQHYKQLTEWYYEELQRALGRLGLEPESVYTREDFEYELKAMLPFGLVVAVFYLPMMMASLSDAAAMCEATDMSDMILKPTPRYSARLNDIIEEYVQWGIL